MKIGYARVSTNEQSLDLQIDALKNDGVSESKIYHDYMSGSGRERPYFESCLKSLREGDTLVIYSLDRMGRSTKDLISILTELKDRKVHVRILDGIAAGIDTSTPMGEVFYTIAAALSQYERATLIQRTKAGLESARARGRVGGRKPKLSRSMVLRAQAAMKVRETSSSELAKELGISTKTLYEYVSPKGELRELGIKVLGNKI